MERRYRKGQTTVKMYKRPGYLENKTLRVEFPLFYKSSRTIIFMTVAL